MTERKFDPARALGAALAAMDQQELCRLTIGLCDVIAAESGHKSYRGGIFPENISRDEDGEVAIGPGRHSDWEGQELQFIAPELYWDGEPTPASDVYSLGLLLYYGLNGGRLPFEGESLDPQLSRMTGKAFSVPASAGVRLSEIVEKACRFKAADRYQTAEELRIVLDSCLENKYIQADSGAELFKKDESDLSEVERMMLAIIGGETAEDTAAEESGAAADAEESVPAPELSREEAAELILAEHIPEKPEEPDREAETQALIDAVFGSPEAEKPEETEEPGKTEEAPEEAPAAGETEAPEGNAAPEEPEDVRVYEPGREKNHVPIPILTEEKNPELAPVVPAKKPRVQYSKDEARNRQITENVKKRRTRPVGVVLILCGLLIIAALVVNAFLRDYEWEDEGRGKDVAMPQVGENAISRDDGFISAEELQRQQEEEAAAARQSYYQIFAGDISWTNAKNACTDMGGMLAVINNSDEFTMVTQLAQQSGIQGVWVGCHREGGFLVWETTEPIGTMSWANGEPSYTDSRDGAAEDYVMLWNTGDGWAYIDCRNDPVYADPNIYSGVIGYVCEFES